MRDKLEMVTATTPEKRLYHVVTSLKFGFSPKRCPKVQLKREQGINSDITGPRKNSYLQVYLKLKLWLDVFFYLYKQPISKDTNYKTIEASMYHMSLSISLLWWRRPYSAAFATWPSYDQFRCTCTLCSEPAAWTWVASGVQRWITDYFSGNQFIKFVSSTVC